MSTLQKRTLDRILFLVTEPMQYEQIRKLCRSRAVDPFHLPLHLGKLVLDGKLQRWESSISYKMTSPVYAPAGMKKPKNFKQPEKIVIDGLGN